MVIIENPASAPSHRLPPVIEKLFSAASRIVEAVMERGARTHRGEDWRTLPAGFHLARARRHLDLLAVGDVSEPHLAHAACRLLMELETRRLRPSCREVPRAAGHC
jgi:hypothetical protein